MKSYIFLLLLLFWHVGPPKLYCQSGKMQEKSSHFTLDNGLAVIIIESPESDNLYLKLRIDRPMMLEQELAGIGQLTGKMLHRQANTGESAEVLQSLAAQMNFDAQGMEAFCVDASLQTTAAWQKPLSSLLSILANSLLTPHFTQASLDTARTIAVNQLEIQLTDPSAIAKRVGDCLIYGRDHPYGEMTTVESLTKVSPDFCMNYYQRYFRPSISTLVLVGNINTRKAIRLVEQQLGQWQARGTMLAEYFEPIAPTKEPSVHFVGLSDPTYTSLRWTYAQYPAGNQLDNPILVVLGGVLSKRINARLREVLAGHPTASLTVNVNWQTDKNIRRFNALIDVPNVLLVEVVEAVERVFEELQVGLLNADELAKIKNDLLASLATLADRPATVAERNMLIYSQGLNQDDYRLYLADIAATEPEQLRAVAQKYLNKNLIQLLVVGDFQILPSLITRDENIVVNQYRPDGTRLYNAGILVPEIVTAKSIINHYLEAIGGREKLSNIDDVQSQWEILKDGMSWQMEEGKSQDRKLYQRSMLYGDTVVETIINKDQVKLQRGGRLVNLTATQLARWREQALIFPELHYLEDKYTLQLETTVEINGKKAYKIVVISPVGLSFICYYDQQSGLKLRWSSEQNEQAISLDFMDYRHIDGILLPHRVISSSGNQSPYVLQLQKRLFNVGLDDYLFNVE